MPVAKTQGIYNIINSTTVWIREVYKEDARSQSVGIGQSVSRSVSQLLSQSASALPPDLSTQYSDTLDGCEDLFG